MHARRLRLQDVSWICTRLAHFFVALQATIMVRSGRLRRRRCRCTGGQDIHAVDVAPAPVLVRLERLDDRMVCCLEVHARVPVLRAVATADVAAPPAPSPADPRFAQLEAFLAPARARRDRRYRVEM